MTKDRRQMRAERLTGSVLCPLTSVVRPRRRRPSSACGRITAQPMRRSGSRPCTGRSNARGTSGTRSGKRSLIAAGGVPGGIGRRPDHDRALALDRRRASPTASARAWRRDRALGRLGAPSATSAAVRGSPATICSGVPVRRSKLSEKKRAMALAGCITLQIDVEPRQDHERGDRHDRRNDQQAEPGRDDDVLAAELDAVAGRHHDAAGRRE